MQSCFVLLTSAHCQERRGSEFRLWITCLKKSDLKVNPGWSRSQQRTAIRVKPLAASHSSIFTTVLLYAFIWSISVRWQTTKAKRLTCTAHKQCHLVAVALQESKSLLHNEKPLRFKNGAEKNNTLTFFFFFKLFVLLFPNQTDAPGNKWDKYTRRLAGGDHDSLRGFVFRLEL